MTRRLLLLIWIALLLVGGVGSEAVDRCAALTPRSCCCKAATPQRGAAVRRACSCGCKVDASAPVPARGAPLPAPERAPVARLADPGPFALRRLAPLAIATGFARARPRGDPLRLDRHCVWRI